MTIGHLTHLRVFEKLLAKGGGSVATAPWWATGVFTILGVMITQIVTALLSRRHDKFEDSRRWHEDRRDIYLEVVTLAWEVQDAVYDHFELGEPLPEDFEDKTKGFERTERRVLLVGSEKVAGNVNSLFLSGHAAISATKADSAGQALNACDDLRHQLYYIIDLMRAELTADKTAVRQWHKSRFSVWTRRKIQARRIKRARRKRQSPSDET